MGICSLSASCSDISYWDHWKEEWKEADINEIGTEWYL